MFGSKLVIKMWETTTEKGIGTLLKPWQIRREGIANIEIERKKMLINAQTERDINEIKQGKAIVSLDDIANPKFIPLKASTDQDAYSHNEPHINLENLSNIVTAQVVAKEVQKEINIAKSLLIAEEILSSDQSEPTNENIEDDWLFRWRDSAATTTSEKLQDLWGRVLAGEMKTPGSYSLRTLDFIKNLSQREASDIQQLFSFELLGSIIKYEAQKDKYENKHLDNFLNVEYLIKMQALGIISGADSLGCTLTLPSRDKNSYVYFIEYDNKIMKITHDDLNHSIQFNVIVFTPLGLELRSLCPIDLDSEYLNFIIKSLKDKGFTVTIGDILTNPDGSRLMINQVVV
ncbi:DUF2806 domain-containing protein [Enterobacter cloacae]|uniref:DUF2806 domain-containing protein n=1 Tax=Enterobacter cloacae TaxID=550 RepID=UPI002FD03C83